VQAQTAPLDAVERLRLALRDATEDAPLREQKLRECVEGLRGMADLRRAVALPEWKDHMPESSLAAVDRAQRQVVADRFVATARVLLRHKDAAAVSLTLDLLVEMAAAREDGVTPSLPRCLTPEVIDLVRNGDPRLRLPAARALASIDPDPAAGTPVFADLLRSSEAALRRAGADGLGNLLQSSATDASRPAVARSDAVATAATLLATLTPAYDDPYGEVRRRCVNAVGKAAAEWQPLVSEPPQPDREADRRPLAARLEKDRADLRPLVLGLRDQVPRLGKAVRDDDPAVRQAALEALETLARLRWQWVRQGLWLAGPGKVGGQADADDPLAAPFQAVLPSLAGTLTDGEVRVRRAALDVLEALGPAAAPAAPAAAGALNDADHFVRWTAVRALQAIGAPAALPAIPALARVLSDTDVDVIKAAIAAIVHLDPTGNGVPPHGKHPRKSAVGALANAIQAHDAEVRIAALRALAGTGENGRPAVPAMAAALGDADVRVRRTAAEALAQLGTAASDAVPDLKLALKDPDPAVREAASDAVLRVTRATQP
jgi:HEAT repeat protein